LSAVQLGGRVVLVGLNAREVTIDPIALTLGKKSLIGPVGAFAPTDFEDVMTLLGRGELMPEVEEIPFAEINAGYDRLRRGEVQTPFFKTRERRARVAGGFDSRPPPPLEPTSDEGATVPAGRVGSQSCSTWSSRCSTHAWLTNFSAHPPSRGDQVHSPQPGASATTCELNASALDADPLRARCGLTGSSTGINSPSSVLVTRT
jgi:hypothetical protein